MCHTVSLAFGDNCFGCVVGYERTLRRSILPTSRFMLLVTNAARSVPSPRAVFSILEGAKSIPSCKAAVSLLTIEYTHSCLARGSRPDHVYVTRSMCVPTSCFLESVERLSFCTTSAERENVFRCRRRTCGTPWFSLSLRINRAVRGIIPNLPVPPFLSSFPPGIHSLLLPSPQSARICRMYMRLRWTLPHPPPHPCTHAYTRM